MSVVAEGGGIAGMLLRQTGQELRSDSHFTMQPEWYTWPQGSCRAASAGCGSSRMRRSVQMGQTSAASDTATVGRAATDSGGAGAWDMAESWSVELETGGGRRGGGGGGGGLSSSEGISEVTSSHEWRSVVGGGGSSSQGGGGGGRRPIC